MSTPSWTSVASTGRVPAADPEASARDVAGIVAVAVPLVDPAIETMDDVFDFEAAGGISPVCHGCFSGVVRALPVADLPLDPVPPLAVYVEGFHIPC